MSLVMLEKISLTPAQSALIAKQLAYPVHQSGEGPAGCGLGKTAPDELEEHVGLGWCHLQPMESLTGITSRRIQHADRYFNVDCPLQENCYDGYGLAPDQRGRNYFQRRMSLMPHTPSVGYPDATGSYG